MKDEDYVKYKEEAEARWGGTDAYKQSNERVAKMTKDEMEKIKSDGNELMKNIALLINVDPKSESVQKLIEEHYNSLRHFYEPNLQIYKGLADMYINDPRFKEHYENYAKGLAQFMHDAMTYFVEKKYND